MYERTKMNTTIQKINRMYIILYENDDIMQCFNETEVPLPVGKI